MHPLADTGRVIAGRYLLEAPIGRGAMGVVWRAHDQLLDREVAVKEVQIAETLTDAERTNAFQRTLREAKTAARLNHPAVVTVYDVAEDEGRPWIVMQLVHARSLDQILASSGPLSPRQAAEVGRQLLSALSVAHSAGVMHRDVKPSNVLLGGDDRAVLTDFGIATFQGDPRLTQTGMVMGSPGFTAPERIRGEAASAASDLWSLGATLFAAVEGHGPFERRGGAITTMSAIINEDAPAAPTAGALGPVIAALLRREPGERPDARTAIRMISDVVPLLGDGPGGGAGYQPTALSAAPGRGPGGIAPSVPAPGAGAAGVPVPAPAPAPVSGDETAGAEETAATTPQAVVSGASGAGYGGFGSSSSSSAAPPPDFSSWYSSSSSRSGAGGAAGIGGASGAGAQGGGQRDGEWPEYRAPRRGRGLWWKIALVVLALLGAGGGTAAALLAQHTGSRSGTGSSTPPTTGTATLASPATAPQIVDAINTAPQHGLPAGWTTFTHHAASGENAGFTIAVPANWTQSTSGHGTFLKGPSGSTYIQIDLTPHTFPNNMLLEAEYIKKQSLALGHFPEYVQQNLAATVVRGTRGSYWKFTWDRNGGQQQVLDILYVAQTSAGPQSYALYMTAPYSTFAQARPVFDEEMETFAPSTG